MKAPQDLTGYRFDRLVGCSQELGEGRSRWLCKCDCGASIVALRSNLVTGVTRSCGCIRREQLAERNRTHGLTRLHPRTYRSWKDMRARCRNPNDSDFANYGGRGISVYDRWDDFAAFIADLCVRPAGLTLDRIDPDGNYEPGNCRWATATEQATNQRRIRLIEHNGEAKTLNQWSRDFGVGRATAAYRLAQGRPFEEVFSVDDFRSAVPKAVPRAV